MDSIYPTSDSRRMCLNHAQTDLEQHLLELDHLLRRWFAHPTASQTRERVLAMLLDLRWQLESHFENLAADEGLATLRRYPRRAEHLEAIQQQQHQLLMRVDTLVDTLPRIPCSSYRVAMILARFEEFHSALLHEEVEERWLIEACSD